MKILEKNKEESQQILNLKEQEETKAVKQLYDAISFNPGEPASFLLILFDIRANVLERRLQKLKDDGKIEYRGTKKGGGYWIR
ncbi:hypothetical protein [Sphingobacterium kitahiroshimense]|uniref:Helix-turn-helix type 11 domain-containing protein n=1 Tax=Sphingobacterium kitahiroshimense TaxID=470446 RepID=A0ABV0BWC0_9SPHI